MKNCNYSIKLICALNVFIGSCASANFTSADFKQKTASHKIVAILPVEMIFSGKQPAVLSPEQIIKIEENESIVFQTSLYNNLLKESGSSKKDIKITFQPPTKTIRLIEEKGLSIRKSWKTPPEELARILQVDGVVKSTVKKTRYISDLASFGINIGVDIIGDVLEGVSGIPYDLSKTNDIYAECNLFHAKDGTLLYNDVYKRETDYNVPANQIVERLTKKFSKTFPYRDK